MRILCCGMHIERESKEQGVKDIKYKTLFTKISV